MEGKTKTLTEPKLFAPLYVSWQRRHRQNESHLIICIVRFADLLVRLASETGELAEAMR